MPTTTKDFCWCSTSTSAGASKKVAASNQLVEFPEGAAGGIFAARRP